MKIAIKKLALRASLLLLAGLRAIVLLIKATLLFASQPLLIVWKRLLHPITIVLYKTYLIASQRLSRFFHAQHKLLALLTHRFTIHVFVVLLTLVVISTNVVQAQTVRSDEFMQKSLVSKIINPEEETTITADTIAPVETSYIDTSTAIKLTPDRQSASQQTNTAAVAQGITTVDKGTLAQSGTVKDSSSTRNTIQEYVVQEGDTASTIAAQFGISTKTVLWGNGLDDASLIKPGQKLKILPTTGIAHKVESGETVESIAQKYKSTGQDIIEYNNFLSAADLEAGAEIIIPNGEVPAPPPPVQTASTQLGRTGSTSRVGSTQPAVSRSATPPPNAAVVGGAKGQWPTSTRRISQYYGAFHTGLDIDGEFGDPIYASDSGRVISAGWEGAYGIAVRVQHANGTVTHYAHLQVLYVQSGQSVGRGQSMGQMGSTGRSSGSHLHFECISGGRFTNPYNCVQ